MEAGDRSPGEGAELSARPRPDGATGVLIVLAAGKSSHVWVAPFVGSCLQPAHHCVCLEFRIAGKTEGTAITVPFQVC